MECRSALWERMAPMGFSWDGLLGLPIKYNLTGMEVFCTQIEVIMFVAFKKPVIDSHEKSVLFCHSYLHHHKCEYVK